MTDNAYPFPLKRCLDFLSEPREIDDEHKAVASLLRYKHDHAIVSTVVRQPVYSFNSLTGMSFMKAAAVRRWELLPGYSEADVRAHRLRGRLTADWLRASAQPAAWPECLQAILHPLERDTAQDVLRGWWS